MQFDLPGEPVADEKEAPSCKVLEPFTFAVATRCGTKTPFVQVRSGPVTCCAQVRSSWIAGDGALLWSVDLLGPFFGSGSFPARLVRQCGGLDGLCLCEKVTAKNQEISQKLTPVFFQAGVVAPPEGLNFENLPVFEGV